MQCHLLQRRLSNEAIHHHLTMGGFILSVKDFLLQTEKSLIFFRILEADHQIFVSRNAESLDNNYTLLETLIITCFGMQTGWFSCLLGAGWPEVKLSRQYLLIFGTGAPVAFAWLCDVTRFGSVYFSRFSNAINSLANFSIASRPGGQILSPIYLGSRR